MSYARAHELVSLCLSRLRDCIASLRAAHTRAVTAHWRVSAGQSVKTDNRLTAHLTVVRQHMHGRVQVGASTHLSDAGSRIIPSLACGRNPGGSQVERGRREGALVWLSSAESGLITASRLAAAPAQRSFLCVESRLLLRYCRLAGSAPGMASG